MKSPHLFTMVCAIACYIITNNAEIQNPAMPDPGSTQPVNPAPLPAPAQPENPAPAPAQPVNPAPVPAPAQPENPAPAPAQPVNPAPVPAPAQPENPSPAQPENPAPAPAQPVNPAPAPAQPENPAPAPAQPVNPAPAPAQPVNPAPVLAPAQPENPAPAPAQHVNPAPAPAQPVNPAPVLAPAQPENPSPAQPVNPAPAPAQPVNPAPAPVQPVNPALDIVQPVNPAPVQPVDPAAVQPVNQAPLPIQSADSASVQPVNPAPAPADPAAVLPENPAPALPEDPSQAQGANQTVVQPVDPVVIKGITHEEVCIKCDCPATILENPYVINCTFRSLNESKPWSPVLLEVDNVHLLLHHNEFRRVPVIAKCDSLDAIDFSYNNIEEIAESAFINIPGIKQLWLAHNRLSHISSDAFHSESLPLDIEYLDLSYNLIDSLHNEAFDQLPYLKKLDLSGNPFHALDSATQTALNNLKVLEELNLAATGLKELPYTLINPIRHLQILNLANNRFKSVPELLQGSQLTELIFSGNLIVELLPSSFIEMSSLQVLEVSFCPNLTAIRKGTLFPLTSLTTFRCNDNPRLKMIERRAFRDENGEGPKEMNTIELRNNSLSSLNEDLFKNIGLVISDTLDASDNPFNCTCHLAWLTQEGPASIYLKDMKCAYPVALQGISLDQVDFSSSSQLPCPDAHDEDVEAHFTYVISESYGFWIFVMIIGLIIIISVAFYVIRSKPELRYSILKIVTPSKVQYREDEAGKVKYTRQYNEDYEDPFNGLDMDLEIYKR